MNCKTASLLGIILFFASLNIACWLFLSRNTHSVSIPQESVLEYLNDTPESSQHFDQQELGVAAVFQDDWLPSGVVDIRIRFHHSVDRKTLTPKTIQFHDDDRAVAWQIIASGDTWVVFRTDSPILSGAVTVTLRKGISSNRKDILPLAGDVGLTLRLTNNFGINDLRVNTPSFGDPIATFSFTRPVDLVKAQAFVTCDPPVAINIGTSEDYSYWGRSYLGISGAFEIGKTYTITFRKGLPSVSGYTLLDTVSRTFTVPRRAPNIRFAVAGRYLPPEGELAIPIESVNMRQMEVKVATVPPQNIVQLMAREAGAYTESYRWNSSSDGLSTLELAVPAGKAIFPLDIAADTAACTTIRLAPLMKDARRGVLLVQASEIESGSSAIRLICVTDLGITARLAKDEAHIWVTSLRSGQPIAGADIRIYAVNNTLSGSGTTDNAGLARIKIPTDENAAPFVITAASPDGEDLSFIPATSLTAVSELNGARGDEYLPPDACTAFLFTDRGIYRHGEDIHFQALLRNSEAEAPKPFPLKLELIRPDWRVYATRTLMPDAAGAVLPNEPLSVPENQPSGNWHLQLSTPGENGRTLGTRTIAIEAFVPPQLRVTLPSVPDGATYTTVPLPFTIHAEHLFGKAAAGLRAEASVSYTEADFDPPEWADYSFGDASRSIGKHFAIVGKGRFDDNGDARFELPFDARLRPPQMLLATLEGTAFEIGGRPVSMRATARLHVYSHYLAIKTLDSGILPVAATNTFAVAIVGHDGVRSSEPHKLVAELFRVSRIYGYIRNTDGSYAWQDEEILTSVEQRTFVTLPDADAPIALAVGTSGEYQLVVTDPATDAATAISFMATDQALAEVRSKLSNPTKIDLSFDKAAYTAGETAQLAITAPFTGTALFSLQRDRILKSEILQLTNTTTIIEIPTESAYYPNLHATISLIRPAEVGVTWRAHRAAGIATLNVTRPEDRLDVRCHPEATPTENGSTVTVSIEVDTTDGPASNAWATLFLTDEGIHLLTNEQTPNPFKFFSAAKAAATRLYDLFGLLMPITDDKTVTSRAATIGGDDTAPQMRRISPVASRRFKPLSLAQTRVPLVDGRAECVFTLPPFAGEVRATAIAWTPTATGASSANIKVSPRLVIKPDAPRFLAYGDRAQLTLALHNQSGDACEATYTLICSGSLTGGEVGKTLSLKAGESRIVSIPVTASDTLGQGLATFTVRGMGETHVETLEIPVRPAIPYRTDVTCTPLPSGKTLTLPLPDDVVLATVAQSLLCHNSAFAEFVPALSYLLNYPYGCLEQTISSAFPLVHAGGALARIAPTDSDAIQETINKVNYAVLRVASLKHERGYTLWHDTTDYTAQHSIYACHFLAEAAIAGVGGVQKETLAENVNLLRSILRQNRNLDDDCAIAAYACHVLALMKEADRSSMLALADHADKLSTQAKAHLARAFALSGDSARALALMQTSAPPATVADAVFGILAWLELDAPEAETQIALCLRTLLDSRTALHLPHWGTTQDNALTLLAIGAIVQRKADPTAVLNVVFTDIDGRLLATVTNRTQVLTAGGTRLTATNAGEGTAYIVRRLLAAPTQERATASANGIEIHRTFRNLTGEAIDPSTLLPGDAVIVELTTTLAPYTDALDAAVIEELLPACFEPAEGSLAAEGTLPWLNAEHEKSQLLRQELRDDRIVFFLNTLYKTATIHYAARVISAGTFAMPPASIEGMYSPALHARTAAGSITIAQDTTP